MRKKSIQIRVDSRLKERVEHIFRSIGIDAPTAIRMFFMKVAATGSIPFPLTEEGESYTAEQIAMLDRLSEQTKRGEDVSKPFSTADDLLRDLHS